MALLGYPLDGSAERADRWEQSLGVMPFDPAVNMLGWEETRRRPALALRLRLALLVRRFDVALSEGLTDWRRLAPKVSAGRERIYFWGSEEAIAAARSWFSGGRLPDDGTLGGLELGTTTYVMEDHGPATIAVADHAASCTTAVPAIGVGLVTCDELFREGVASMRTEIRSRHPAPGVPSGMASHLLAVREFRLSYWGVAPWYIGWGEHEMLGYFELPADPERTRRMILDAPGPFIADASDRAFADALVALNLGEDRPAAADAPPGTKAQAGPIRWEVHLPGPLLMPWHRAVVRPTRRRDGSTLDAALSTVAATPRNACTTVEVPVEDPAFLPVQRQLVASGFQLAALAPPVHIEGEGRLGFTGLWTRVTSELPVAAPYYLTSTLLNNRESEVVSHVHRLSDRWTGHQRASRAA
ncbi:MAG TPA: hypothetical protein VF517_11405 [Thermoleophilaceae bacterium]|jgi:hypothetical protein